VTATGDDLTNTDDPFKVAMRQIAGAFAQLEKARLVSKLKASRDRKRKETGKCEGRKSFAEMNPELVALVKRLRRASPKTGERRSLREISAELARLGHLNERGQPFNPASIKSMLEQ
jgi:DNA invertase Pin-like site-specific DNA recombinase